MADILKVKDFVRVRLTRNGAVLYDQPYNTLEETYTVHTTERAVLATNMATSQEVNMGGVTVGKRLFLETDRSIQVGLGVTPGAKWTLEDNGVMAITASFSHIWVLNTGSQEARIHYLVTD